jgi:hypothetical protein
MDKHGRLRMRLLAIDAIGTDTREQVFEDLSGSSTGASPAGLTCKKTLNLS